MLMYKVNQTGLNLHLWEVMSLSVMLTADFSNRFKPF